MWQWISSHSASFSSELNGPPWDQELIRYKSVSTVFSTRCRILCDITVIVNVPHLTPKISISGATFQPDPAMSSSISYHGPLSLYIPLLIRAVDILDIESRRLKCNPLEKNVAMHVSLDLFQSEDELEDSRLASLDLKPIYSRLNPTFELTGQSETY